MSEQKQNIIDAPFNTHVPSLSELPDPNTQRWDSKRKAQVVAAVRAGVLSIEQATDTYDMSIEEFLSWQLLYERYGANGLTVKHAHKYRNGN